MGTMRAINGYVEDGYFKPTPIVELPKRFSAILIVKETECNEDVPNPETIEAIKESECILNDPNAKTYASFSELLAEVEEEMAEEEN